MNDPTEETMSLSRYQPLPVERFEFRLFDTHQYLLRVGPSLLRVRGAGAVGVVAGAAGERH